jgi:WD40 repeat protein
MNQRRFVACLFLTNILILSFRTDLSIAVQASEPQIELVSLLEVSEDAPVIDIAFSPDGLLIATLTGSPGNSIQIWNVVKGEIIQTLIDPSDWSPSHIQFTPDGKSLIADGVGGPTYGTSQLVSWDVDTGVLDQQGDLIDGHITATAISQDGMTVVCGMSFFNGHNFSRTGAVYSWAIEALNHHKVILSEREGEVREVEFSSDGHFLAYVVNSRFSPDSLDGMSSLDILALDQAPVTGYIKVWDIEANKTNVIGTYDALIQVLSL